MQHFSYHPRLRNMAPPENLDEKDILRGIQIRLMSTCTGAFLGNWPTYSGENLGRKNLVFVSGNNSLPALLSGKKHGDRHVPQWRQELSFKSCCSQRNLLQIRWGFPEAAQLSFCVGKRSHGGGFWRSFRWSENS